MRNRYHLTTGSISIGHGNGLKTFWAAWDADENVFVKNSKGEPVMFDSADDAFSFCDYLNGFNPETEHHSKERNASDYYHPEIE
jgi:hypothetical protein